MGGFMDGWEGIACGGGESSWVLDQQMTNGCPKSSDPPSFRPIGGEGFWPPPPFPRNFWGSDPPPSLLG